jgi:hypothetical protein
VASFQQHQGRVTANKAGAAGDQEVGQSSYLLTSK